jgi:hypothetical protein
MESIWAGMQVQLLDRCRWRTRIELANAICSTRRSVNRRRRHSSLGRRAPIELENRPHGHEIQKSASTGPVADQSLHQTQGTSQKASRDDESQTRHGKRMLHHGGMDCEPGPKEHTGLLRPVTPRWRIVIALRRYITGLPREAPRRDPLIIGYVGDGGPIGHVLSGDSYAAKSAGLTA